MKIKTLLTELLQKIDACWSAANDLSLAPIDLHDNPRLKRPLARAEINHMLLGHSGAPPGQNSIQLYPNRVIKEYDLDMIDVTGSGHCGPAVVANPALEGSYSEGYPHISQGEAGWQKLFKQFSFPGGIFSHGSPECSGSIHAGGELGYSLNHLFGAVFHHPDLLLTGCVDDGEAQPGPLATSWQSNKFLDPINYGAARPILHLKRPPDRLSQTSKKGRALQAKLIEHKEHINQHGQDLPKIRN
ncbi:MAG: xylulose-5-phosphate/fructose-6-phosphate phosphoketolase [Lentimonas sp.]|jgi:xylulose-5-phosphate/fructose-6-phosphate phosphoketolase